MISKNSSKSNDSNNIFVVKKCYNTFDIPPSYRSCGICRSPLDINTFWNVSRQHMDSLSPLHACSLECANMAIFMSME